MAECPPDKEKKESKEKKEKKGEKDAKKRPAPSAERIFKHLDKDGDGSLTKAEFVGKAQGPAATRKEAQFDKVDADKSGGISLKELQDAFAKRKGPKDGKGKDKEGKEGKEGKGKKKDKQES